MLYETLFVVSEILLKHYNMIFRRRSRAFFEGRKLQIYLCMKKIFVCLVPDFKKNLERMLLRHLWASEYYILNVYELKINK